MGKLTARLVAGAKPGRHGDGGGLHLLVKESGTRSWVLRVVINGRRRDLGLGPADLVSLSEARDKATEGRRMARAGVDPTIAWKRADTSVPSFEEIARQYHSDQEVGWKNPKHRAQWLSTLVTYAFPTLGRRLPDEIDANLIWAALGPIWQDKPETARRVRQRILTVLDFAKAMGWRASDAPDRALARIVSKQRVRPKHHSAMPYSQLPGLMEKLQREPASVGRLGLQFAILTAARSGEVRGATWREINAGDASWVVPSSRMKAGVEHTVPLSAAALDIIKQLRGLVATGPDDPVFPGAKGRPLSDATLIKALRVAGGGKHTVHGMRSSFRDWIAEKLPSVPRDVAEAALAHAVADKVEAAYRRTKYLDQRRPLMKAWSEFLAGRTNVVALAERRA